MKIFVVPRQFIKKISYKSNFFKTNNFISIGEVKGQEGVPVDGENILKLVFDDISDKETGNLFTEEQAQKIKNFVDHLDKTKSLFINCQAGISRSGAVGIVLNDYINYMQNGCIKNRDWFEFFEINTRIRPNAYIARVLKKTLGFY